MSCIPVFSVVIPLFNKRPHIARALNSVLSQTFRDFEVIVIDDGSTDGGGVIVEGIKDSRLRLISQDNRGVSAARNRGISESRAELIAFLDADDEWQKDHLEVLYRLYLRWPEAGVYSTAYLKKTGSTFFLPRYPRKQVPKRPWEGLIPDYFKVVSDGDMLVSSSTAAIPRSILAEVGGFDEKAWTGEDMDLWGRIALKYRVAFSWEGMGIYHTDATNRACNTHLPLVERSFTRSARMMISEGSIPSELKEGLYEYLSNLQLRTAYNNLAAGRPELAIDNLSQCSSKKHRAKQIILLVWAHLPGNLIRFLCLVKRKIIPD